MNTPSIFRDLQISDLYIRLDSDGQAIYQGQKKGRQRINAVVPHGYDQEIRQITDFVRNQGLEEDSILQFKGVRLRMSRQHMADGEDWMCLRVIKNDIPKFEQLGMVPAYVQAMRNFAKRDGLIMITGATGHGKTTTACSLLVDYLTHEGGIAVTIEDPVEYVMKGRHGESGFCFQVEVDGAEGWANAIRRSLRWAPHYIFVGEIRTPQAAEQVLRAATTGHLVITTVHAGSAEEALMGMIHLAEQAMGGGANHILAAGLTAVVHQTMSEAGPSIRLAWTETGNMGDPVRALIRENKIGMITTYIDKTSAKLLRTGDVK